MDSGDVMLIILCLWKGKIQAAVLVVYIDIVVTGNDDEEINKLKAGLRTEFEI